MTTPRKKTAPGPWLHLDDGLGWPHPDDPEEVEFRLRYGKSTSRDASMGAAYVAAYRTLICCSSRRRAVVVRALRAAMKVDPTRMPF